MLTDKDARDEILALLETAWQADADSTNLPLLYENTTASRPADGSAYAVALIRKVDNIQATLANETGQRRFRTFGIVTVQIRTPQGDGYTLSDKLSRVARDAFRGRRTSNGVVFTRARVKEAGADGTYALVNVIADFEYDEIA